MERHLDKAEEEKGVLEDNMSVLENQ